MSRTICEERKFTKWEQQLTYWLVLHKLFVPFRPQDFQCFLVVEWINAGDDPFTFQLGNWKRNECLYAFKACSHGARFLPVNQIYNYAEKECTTALRDDIRAGCEQVFIVTKIWDFIWRGRSAEMHTKTRERKLTNSFAFVEFDLWWTGDVCVAF